MLSNVIDADISGYLKNLADRIYLLHVPNVKVHIGIEEVKNKNSNNKNL